MTEVICMIPNTRPTYSYVNANLATNFTAFTTNTTFLTSICNTSELSDFWYKEPVAQVQVGRPAFLRERGAHALKRTVSDRCES